MTNTIKENLNKIIKPASSAFDSLGNLGIHIATSSKGIAGSAKNATDIAAGPSATLNETKYTLTANQELVNCIQPKTAGTHPVVLSIKTQAEVDQKTVNTTQNVAVDVEWGGIAFEAKAEFKLNPVGTADDANVIDVNKSTFFISKITIAADTKFDGTKLFNVNQDKNIDFNEGTDNLKEMTLEQLKTLFANKIQVSTQVQNEAIGIKIFSVLEIENKQEETNMNNNNTNQDETDEKTTWKDIAIIVTAIASIFGVGLLAKMSSSPSNSEYYDNIKFDDYKDDLDSITI